MCCPVFFINILFMPLIGIDIFSGAGGLSYGATMAGVDVKLAIEINKYAASTFVRNHPNASVITADITTISASEVLNKIGKNVFVIMGGPPCQGFSLSNTMNRNMDNPKNLLFREFVRLVGEIKPQWFVFENVYGFTKINSGDTELMVKHCFEELGYKVNSKVLWASDYGVPQRRNRYFMVGNLNGINFDFPSPNFKQITVSEAIDDLPVLINGQMDDDLPYRKSFEDSSLYAQSMRSNSNSSKQNFVSLNSELVVQRYHYIGQGQNWRAIPDFLMTNYADKSRCHSGIYKRLIAEEPSVVISNYRKSMLIHPTQDRGLSVREAARIQSFPDDFIFDGPHMSIQQQIGNAVPPLLAKAVFDQIIEQSKANRRYE